MLTVTALILPRLPSLGINVDSKKHSNVSAVLRLCLFRDLLWALMSFHFFLTVIQLTFSSAMTHLVIVYSPNFTAVPGCPRVLPAHNIAKKIAPRLSTHENGALDVFSQTVRSLQGINIYCQNTGWQHCYNKYVIILLGVF